MWNARHHQNVVDADDGEQTSEPKLTEIVERTVDLSIDIKNALSLFCFDQIISNYIDPTHHARTIPFKIEPQNFRPWRWKNLRGGGGDNKEPQNTLAARAARRGKLSPAAATER